MSDLTLSLLGIYNQDPTIMDAQHLILPEDMDRNTLLPMVLSESAELEVVYPDPSTLKVVMAAWSRARRPSWEKMLAALDEEYDALHNYDRTETESGTTTGSDSGTETETIEDELAEDISDTTTGNTSTTRTGSEDTTRSTTGSEDTTKTGSGTETTAEDIADTGSSTNSGTSTGQVTGFNVQTFADNDKQITSGTGSTTGSRDRDQTVTTSNSETVGVETEGSETVGVETEDSETGTSRGTAVRDRDQTYGRDRSVSRSGQSSGSHSRTLRAYGNIGVTTSQQMLREELEVRIMDIYRLVADELVSYFCLRIY